MRQTVKSTIAGIISLLAVSVASAQQFPTVPSRSVIGRLGVPGTTGPSQAIPFSLLFSQIAGIQLPVVSGDLACFTGTVGQLADCTSILPSGLTLPSPNFTGSPTLAFGQNADTAFTVNNPNPGTSALSSYLAINSANFANFGIGGTAYTGLALFQNRAFVNASSGSAGLVLNNAGANPIIFGISSAEVGRWSSSNPGELDAKSVAIAPTALSLNQGLVITQSGPTSGSTAGPQASNVETISFGSTVTGSGTDSFGASNTDVFGHRINFSVIGSNVTGTGLIHGLGVVMPVTATSAFKDSVAVVGAALIQGALTNTGSIEGIAAYAAVQSGSVTKFTGLETTASIMTAATAVNRAGMVISNTGQVQASTIDAAMVVSSNSSSGLYQKFVYFSSGWLLTGNHGLTTTADLFSADTSLTIGNVFNFVSGGSGNTTSAAVTCTNFLLLPSITITCGGVESLGSTQITGATLNVFNTSATTAFFVNSTTPGVASGAGMTGYMQALPTGADQRLGFLLFGSLNGTTGGTTDNNVGLIAFSSAAWTQGTSQPAYLSVFTTNTANSGARREVARWQASGGFSVGNGIVTTDPGDNNMVVNGTVRTIGVAIASLPSCGAGNAGARTYVTNGVTSPTFLGTVSTTGAVVAPVMCNGTNWIYGQLEPANDNEPLARKFA